MEFVRPALPTPESISKFVDVTIGDARIIRAIMEKYYDDEYSQAYEHPSFGIARCLKDIDKVMNGHGVESCWAINEGGDMGDVTQSPWDAHYVNVGHTYSGTIIFLSGNHPKGWTEGFKLMCWGGLYE